MTDKLPDDVIAFLWRCFESQIPPLDLQANDLLHKYQAIAITHPGTDNETWTVPLSGGEID